MRNFIKFFLPAIFLFAILDFIWLGFVMLDFNTRQLAEIGRYKDGALDMLYLPAFAVYILMAASLSFFVIPKLAKNSSSITAFFVGAAMGLCIYGVFDMTNYAILKNYPLPFAFVDMAWGSFAYGITTLVLIKFRDRKTIS